MADIQIKNKRIATPKWEEPAERLVLYADIMGFKSRVMDNSHEVLRNDISRFRNDWESRMKPFLKADHLRYVQFSDSILIVVNGVDDKMFNLITKAAFCLMHTAISNRFPLKGVITQGTFTYDKSRELYFGRPLVDAALLHDEIKYYGIVVHNSAEATVKAKGSLENRYCKSEVPLDKGSASHFHLAWNMVNQKYKPEDITSTCNLWLDVIEEQVSGKPRTYIDNTRKVFENDRHLQPVVDEDN